MLESGKGSILTVITGKKLCMSLETTVGRVVAEENRVFEILSKVIFIFILHCAPASLHW